MSEERVTKIASEIPGGCNVGCLDCGMEPPVSEQGRCAGCQRDWEIRLARRLARTAKEEN